MTSDVKHPLKIAPILSVINIQHVALTASEETGNKTSLVVMETKRLRGALYILDLWVMS